MARSWKGFGALALGAIVGGTLGSSVADAKTKDGKYLIYYSMSYVGNAWQAEAKNAITAMSKTAAYRDKVELRVQASGANAQRQIEQINAMIQAGADAIVAFPISPTALNGVIKTACDKKVVFVAVNGVTEPCAYNVKIDGVKHGAKQAKWVFEAIGGKGNVVYITGVPGVSYSEDYGKGVMETAKNYPGVHITGTLVGMWDQQSLARVKMKEFLASCCATRVRLARRSISSPSPRRFVGQQHVLRLDQGGFAGAVLTDDRSHLAARDGERDILEWCNRCLEAT
jgi:ribose transport system substrate-binding protein